MAHSVKINLFVYDGMWREHFELPCANDRGERTLTWFQLRHAIHKITGQPLPMNLTIDGKWCEKTLDGIVTQFNLTEHNDRLDVFVSKSPDDMHAFHYAAKWGNIDVMRKWLVAGLPIDFADEDGMTATMHAASEDKVDVVRALVSYGADMNAMDNKNQTAVMWAVHGGAVECLKFLLESDAFYDDANNMNMTPIMQASYYKYYPTFSLIAQKYQEDGLMTQSMFERLEQLHRYYVIRDYYETQRRMEYDMTH